MRPPTTAVILLSLFSFTCMIVAKAQDSTGTAKVQEGTGVDGLFLRARQAAFDQKDYARAKMLAAQALKISPDYADILIFLGRIYTWTHQYDSARIFFEEALNRDATYEDAYIAFADLEYWNDHYDRGLTICDRGLKYHPGSEELMLRKAKLLYAEKLFSQADTVAGAVLRIDRNNAAARSLQDRLKELAAVNKIGVSYDFVYFDKQFKDPWHLVSAEYGRSSKAGMVTARINYANRFREGAVQYEIEAYPHFSKKIYSYAEMGYSSNETIFPHWRAGFSLYGNLPASFEGELGFRYLLFSGLPTWIYTAYLGKYYKNWLFGARAYVTPASFSPAVSNSYSLSARYYYGSADDLIGISAGYGLSPDDRYNIVQLDAGNRLVSYNLGLNFKKKIGIRHVLSVAANWLAQEYLPGIRGNQIQAGLAWLYRF